MSGTANIPPPRLLEGTISFFVGNLTVLRVVIFLPALATWLPEVPSKALP